MSKKAIIFIVLIIIIVIGSIVLFSPKKSGWDFDKSSAYDWKCKCLGYEIQRSSTFGPGTQTLCYGYVYSCSEPNVPPAGQF